MFQQIFRAKGNEPENELDEIYFIVLDIWVQIR